MIFIIFSIASIINCDKQTKDGLFVAPQATEDKILTFHYGFDDSLSKPSDTFPEFGFYPSIRKTDKSICLDSRHIKTFDLGPRLSICFPTSQHKATNDDSSENNNSPLVSNEVFDSVVESLIYPDEFKSYPMFRIQTEIGEISFSFISEQILRNEFKKTSVRDWFFADSKLSVRLSLDSDFHWFGKKGFISKSYGMPYWNSYKMDNICYVLFSPWNIDIPTNTKRLLRIQIPCDTLEKEMESFILSVDEFNELQLIKCSKDQPIISEFFNHSSSRILRYLEFYNPGSSSVCLNQLIVLDSKNNHTLIDFTGKILFPYSSFILVENNAVIEGMVVPDSFPWTDLSNSKITIGWVNSSNTNLEITPNIFENHIDSVNLTESLNSMKYYSSFHYEGEFFSRDHNLAACANKQNVYKTEEKHCGSVGIPNYRSAHAIRNCRIDDIELTEINAFGLLNSYAEKITRAKFVELETNFPANTNSGNIVSKNICDLSALSLQIGSYRYPLAVQEFTVTPDQTILISAYEDFSEKIPRIPRNIYNLKWTDPIDLIEIENPSRIKNIYPGIISEIVEQNIDGKPISLIKATRGSNTAFLHHPRVLHSHEDLEHNAYMSPGVKTSEISGNSNYKPENIKISEINWAGSFSNGKSILTDRFLEWKNDSRNYGSFLLDLKYPLNPSRNRSFLVPIGLASYGLLSNSNLTCYPYIQGYIQKDFQLYNDLTEISILDPFDNHIIDSTILDPNLAGMNATSTHMRKSAVRSIVPGIWKDSESYSNVCIGNNFASPGSSNFHKPFIFFPTDVNDNIDHSFVRSLVRSEGDPNSNFQIKFFQPFTNETNYLDVHFYNTELFQNVPFEDSLNKDLVYSYINEELDGIFAADGLLIEALQPLPGSGRQAWIQICNRSNNIYDVNNLILETEKGRDYLRPSDGSPYVFLYPNQCAVITSNISQCLPPSFIQNDFFLQFQNNSKFPGGFNSKTAIDLFLRIGGKETHLHSYGNKYLGTIDTITLTQAKIAKIRKSTLGGSSKNYSIEVSDL